MSAEQHAGAAVSHEAAYGHVTGTAHYVDDLPTPPNTLHVATAWADLVCGTARPDNLDQVRRLPGVVDIIEACDIPGAPDIGAIFPGDLLLTEGVDFHGQPVVAIAATSFRTAQQACRHVSFRSGAAPASVSLQHALEHEDLVLPSRDWGDREVEICGAHTIEGALLIGGQEHFYLEGQVALALPTDDHGVFVYSSTQHPDEVQHAVAKVLGLALHKVTVECPRMGGGFGGKESQAAAPACFAALAAWRTGRPAKCRLPRHADMQQTGKRHEFQWQYGISYDIDGRLLQGDLQMHGNCGHSPDLSGGIVERAMFHATNAYAFERVRLRGHHRRVNQVSHTAFRGFGGPQGMLGIEASLDTIAYKLGVDPVEIRRRNFYRPGADTTPYGQKIDDFVLPELFERLLADCDYELRKSDISAFNGEHEHLKRALAVTPVQFGISFTVPHLNQAGALVHLYRDGTIQVNHGGTEMGQGLHTKIIQIVAAAFGLPLKSVRCTATRTDKVPNASPTAASSGSDMNGFAAYNACATIIERMQDFAREELGLQDDLVFADGAVTSGQTSFSFAEFVQQAYLGRVSLSATGYYATPEIHFDKERGEGNPFYYFAYGAAASEVVIDTRSGDYRFLRTDIIHDAGRSLNPAIDRGQIEGGYMQGLGWLTCEELVFADGRLASNGPANYKIPTADMCPATFNVTLHDRDNAKPTIRRSKAVGEPPLMLAISAWCALRQACAAAGNTLPHLAAPATPEAVYWAIQEARA
ncbi:MAG: xanthine dehydrogenase molybdopterin binding subunit [Pseudomonadota bacterium]